MSLAVQQTELLEPGDDLVDRLAGVLGLLAAGDDELAGAKQQRDDVRVVEPVDEPRELLGFVLDVLQAEADGNGVEVEVPAQVGAGDDVLDDDLGVLIDLDLEVPQLVEDDAE